MTKELNTANTNQNDDIQITRQQQQQQLLVDSSEANLVFDSIPTGQNRYQALHVPSPSSQVSFERPRHQSGAHANTSGVSVNNFKSVGVIGDSVIKHIDPKNLSPRHVHKFSYPGKTTGEIAEAVDSIAVVSDPSHVIIHTGTNNLPTESAESCVTEVKSLTLKEKNKFPNSSIGLSEKISTSIVNVSKSQLKRYCKYS